MDLSRRRVALATCAQLADLDAEGRGLVAALAGLGVEAVPMVWDDPDARWDQVDLVVVRSTWDYTRRAADFHAWARRTAQATRVLNGPDLLGWSGDKRYLLDLAAAGVPVIETTILAPGDATDHHLLDVEHVVKPTVSAGSRDTLRLAAGDHERSRAHAAALLDAGREVIVQPYLAEVDSRGETALVHVEGELSHAVRKAALLAPGAGRVEGLYAEEEVRPRTPTVAEQEVARLALAALPGGAAPLYARVDLLPTPHGPLLLELELVEPSLFLDLVPGATERFAAAIVQRLVADR